MVCPIVIYGSSTGLAPIHVRIKAILMKDQNNTFFCVENFLFKEFFFIIGARRMRIEASIANTPPSLDGIDRRIAYANRKYHSGWMCGGVVDLLAVLKFSTSPNILGLIEIISINKMEMKIIGIVSFTAKYGKNLILSIFGLTPRGLEDPLLCNRIRCISTRAAITIGKIK